MRLRCCFLGLAIASATLVPFNAQAESKPSDCQAFYAAMARYHVRTTYTSNDQSYESVESISGTFYKVRISDASNEPTDPQDIAEDLLMDLNLSIKDLEGLTFSDATLRSLHQQFLGYVIAGRDHLATSLSETKRGEQAKADAAFGELQRLPYQISEVYQQFEQYCGKATSNP
ncbi:hypothetical protein ACQ4M3_02485 [Leptolyngbya sp. AN03gr2]|uniref:hypothetical protein n=1 Tax=unclassified Leptolyngbya TaxID=2650499 RepID=UPI003D311131